MSAPAAVNPHAYCLEQGHDLRSAVVGKMIDPRSSLVIDKFETFCTQCGMTRDEVRAYKPKRLRSPNKNTAKAPASTGEI